MPNFSGLQKNFVPSREEILYPIIMAQEQLPRVLITTAGYGEGHNSAAKGLAQALDGKAETLVVDLFAEAMPSTFKVTRSGYLWIISRMPALWKLMYDVSDRRNIAEKPIAGLGPVESLLEKTLETWKPDFVVSTYMVYPYMLDTIFQRRPELQIPYITVVTDSIVINKTWICSNSPLWTVTDNWTRDIMIEKGVPADRICVTKFPVNPKLHEIRQIPISWSENDPFRVLYFAQRSAQFAHSELTAMLEADERIYITCILGKRFKSIYPKIKELRTKFGRRLIIRGWTKQVPMYLATHHVVVGKAGGATVHEVLSAARPMLVNFLLPGQEEGNTQLLEKLGAGRYVATASALAENLTKMMADNGAEWKSMYDNLLKANMTNGARCVADLVLNRLAEKTN